MALAESLGPPHILTHLVGLTLAGNAPLWVGGRPRYAVEAAVKQAFDPDHRFPSLDE